MASNGLNSAGRWFRWALACVGRLGVRAVAWLMLVVLVGCADPVRRFHLQDPVWQDDDQHHVEKEPGEYYSGLVADAVDNMAFRPLAEGLYLPLSEEAWNVNSVDEVPNSSWFQNRIGLFPMTPADVARGSCDAPPPSAENGPWLVVGGKPDGANPGFFIKTPDGSRYLLKFDSATQPQRATSGDVIGSKIYWAAGYHAPCNQVTYFKSDILKIADDATKTNEYGEKVPLTKADVTRILTTAYRLKDGTLRASSSKFLPGKPLGPWRYEGTRSDDPNDIIPHEHRRELRGAKLFAAWLGHIDSREQNSLDLWVREQGKTFIRHYYLDWGDCLGSYWEWDGITRRMDHSGYADLDHIFVDFVTLGLLSRPWHNVHLGPEAETFGYWNVDDFDPENWRGGYYNAAFEEMTHRDALWATRIIGRFTDAHIAAAVGAAGMTNKRAEAWITKTIAGRRDKILHAYLTQYSPLERFMLVRRTPGDSAQSLCFEDQAIRTGVADPLTTFYRVELFGDVALDRQLGWVQFRPDPDHPHRSCISLPLGHVRPHELAGPGAPDTDSRRYSVLQIGSNQTPSMHMTAAIRVHLYDLGPERGFRIVGLDRPRHPSSSLY